MEIIASLIVSMNISIIVVDFFMGDAQNWKLIN